LKKLLIVWAILVSSMAQADPGIPDTVRIDDVTCHAPGVVVLPVYFFNDELLSAVEVVFKYDDNCLTLDSFSLHDGRLDYIPIENVFFQDSAGAFDLWIPDWDGFIPEGSGLMARLYFSMPENLVNHEIPIDTITWPSEEPIVRKTLFSNEYAFNIYPQFIRGHIYAAAICGDIDCDNIVNLLDIIYLIDYKFKGGPSPQYPANSDVNHDGLLNLLDILYLIDFKFSHGPGPYCISHQSISSPFSKKIY